jgi:hypothetical protein
MQITSMAVSHVRVETGKGFAEVKEGVERQLGRFEAGVFRSLPAEPKEAERQIGAMAGPGGFMLFGTMDHRALLSMVGQQARAV